MAETVKKSRIVSETDENLEESLLQEFNLRLNKCMSRDDLETENPDDDDDNVIIETSPKHNSYKKVDSSEDFINVERDFCSSNHNGTRKYENGSADQHLELENDSPIHLTKNVNNGDQCSIEDFDKNKITLTSSESCDVENLDAKSVKDRMLLSIDDASCLLFTQTVTSPMLTPSEENIDFLKGLRRESSQATLSDHTNSSSSPKMDSKVDDVPNTAEEIIYENTSFVPCDPIYENVDLIKNQSAEEAANLNQIELEPESQVAEDDETQAPQESNIFDQNQNDDSQLFFQNQNDGNLHLERPQADSPIVEQIHEDIQKVDQTHNDDVSQAVEQTQNDDLQTLDVSQNFEQTHDKSHQNFEQTHTVSRNFEQTQSETVRIFEQTQNDLNQREEAELIEQLRDETKKEREEKVVKVRSETVKTLKNHFLNNTAAEPVTNLNLEMSNDELDELKSLNIMKQIHKFESTSSNSLAEKQEVAPTNVFSNEVSTVKTQSHFVETTTEVCTTGDVSLKKKKTKKSKNQHEKENISVNEIEIGNKEESFYNVNVKNLKSSFSKFDALQKKNLKNEQDATNGGDVTNCKKCGKAVFQMERIVAEKCIYHRNCFRCVECSKQLLVDNFESHEGALYCKPHFKALFAPKAVEDDTPVRPRKHELIIRENQPVELPPDVARASDKPDLGLEELQSLNMKERFRVFENAQTTTESHLEKNPIKMERSPSILSKLARFQAKGMNVGVSDDALNGIPIEASSSGEEEEEDELDGEDAELIRAKRVQKEKPFHFSQMSDVKSKWEQGNQQNKDDRREERKQEIQNIRSRLFMGKQGKMKEAYQQAIAESESSTHVKKEVPVESPDTRSIKDRFEKGEVINNDSKIKESEDMSVFESGISKQSRSIFQELDSIGGKPLKVSPTAVPKLGNSVRNAREAYIAKQSSEDTIRSTDQQDEIIVRTADIQNKFKFFETYTEPQQKRKEFRITPPREGQIKSTTPEREVFVDPEVVRSDECIEDSVVAKSTHTATKMLSKFRQMEENLQKAQEPLGLKPLKRFTPPREPLRRDSSSEEESEEEQEQVDGVNLHERDLNEAKKAARAKQLKDKFERWDENECDIRRDNSVSIIEEYGEDQSQIETAKSLRAKFESLKEVTSNQKQTSRVKVNRFVNTNEQVVNCQSCDDRVYPLEIITVHNLAFHKNCFRCKQCNSVLRMETYCYNQGLLYCKTHFKRLFITKGNYDSAFGLEQHKEKWNATTVA